MKILSLFSGIGAFEKALANMGVDYELVAYCEIDKYASKSYSAIHNVPETMNLGDITKVDEKALPKDIDLITYGFPCQDISVAGKGKGLFNEDGTKTRSGLFFDALRIIEETQPRVAIAENVKNLVGKRFKEQFQIVLDSLNEAGYNNYWKVLNAKDFGVPQNRERVFIVSIRKDIDTGMFRFPEGFPLKLRLKDLLEEVVDEKYYLPDAHIEKMKHHTFASARYENRVASEGGISPTLLARDYKDPKCVEIEKSIPSEPKVKVAFNLYEMGVKGFNRDTGEIMEQDGLCKTIQTMQGGNRQPKILIREATSKGYAEAEEGDFVNLDYPSSTTRRGRVGKQIANTLASSGSIGGGGSE